MRTQEQIQQQLIQALYEDLLVEASQSIVALSLEEGIPRMIKSYRTALARRRDRRRFPAEAPRSSVCPATSSLEMSGRVRSTAANARRSLRERGKIRDFP